MKKKIQSLPGSREYSAFFEKASRDLVTSRFLYYAQYFLFFLFISYYFIIIIFYFKGNNSKQHTKILLTLNQSYHVNIITNMVRKIFAVHFLCFFLYFYILFNILLHFDGRFPSRQFAVFFLLYRLRL